MEKRQRRNLKNLFTGLFIPNCLAKFNGISLSAKMCYGRLLQYSDESGCSYPSQQTLAEEIGLSVSHIGKLLKELEDNGFIEKEHPTGKERLMHKTVRYYFLDHEIFDDAPVRTSVVTDPKRIAEVKRRAEQKVERAKKKIFSEDSIEMSLAGLLYERIFERLPNFKEPNLQEWAKHIDFLLRVDKKDSKEVEEVLEWSQKESFWQPHILSTEALRKKYNTLYLQMKQPKKNNFNKNKEGLTPAGGIAPIDTSKYDKFLEEDPRYKNE